MEREVIARGRSVGEGRFSPEGLQTSPLPRTAAGATVGPPPLSCGLVSGSKTLRPVVLDSRVLFFSPEAGVYWAPALGRRCDSRTHAYWVDPHPHPLPDCPTKKVTPLRWQNPDSWNPISEYKEGDTNSLSKKFQRIPGLILPAWSQESSGKFINV